VILRFTPRTAELIGETSAQWELLEQQVRGAMDEPTPEGRGEAAGACAGLRCAASRRGRRDGVVAAPASGMELSPLPNPRSVALRTASPICPPPREKRPGPPVLTSGHPCRPRRSRAMVPAATGGRGRADVTEGGAIVRAETPQQCHASLEDAKWDSNSCSGAALR
jgi:hypothetical protein